MISLIYHTFSCKCCTVVYIRYLTTCVQGSDVVAVFSQILHEGLPQNVAVTSVISSRYKNQLGFLSIIKLDGDFFLTFFYAWLAKMCSAIIY